MRVWKIGYDCDNFAVMGITGLNGEAFDFFEFPYFEGEKVQYDWSLFSEVLLSFNPQKPISNLHEFVVGGLALDSYAFLKLKKILPQEIQLFPLKIDDIDMKIVNILDVIDCLDKTKSDIEYFDNSKDVMDVNKYVFKTNPIKNRTIFKIPQLVRTELFATDRFRDAVLDFCLSGLLFELVYED